MKYWIPFFLFVTLLAWSCEQDDELPLPPDDEPDPMDTMMVDTTMMDTMNVVDTLCYLMARGRDGFPAREWIYEDTLVRQLNFYSIVYTNGMVDSVRFGLKQLFFYNAQGLIDSLQNFPQPEDTLFSASYYSYNSANQLIEILEDGPGLTNNSIIQLEYNNLGFLSRANYLYADSVFHSYALFFPEDNGNVLTRENYDPTGLLTSRSVFEYDDQKYWGLALPTELLNSNANNIIRQEQYDGNGVLVEASSYSSSYEYNEWGYPVLETRTFDDGRIQPWDYTYFCQ